MDADLLDAWDGTLRSTTAKNAEVTAAVHEMTVYLTRLVAAKRAHPADDMLSTLIAARDDGDRLSEGELVSFCLVLFTGGYGTTANRLAGIVHLLLEQPERYVLLCREGHRVPGAVEELLRYAQAAMGANVRVATESVRLGDVTVGEGSRSSRSWRPPTTTRTSIPTPACSTSPGPPSATLPSVTASTSASARSSPAYSSRKL